MEKAIVTTLLLQAAVAAAMVTAAAAEAVVTTATSSHFCHRRRRVHVFRPQLLCYAYCHSSLLLGVLWLAHWRSSLAVRSTSLNGNRGEAAAAVIILTLLGQRTPPRQKAPPSHDEHWHQH